MKLKAGDRIKFLNETGEGVLISFIDKDKALVRIDDGFEIPVMISELVSFGGDYFSDNKEDKEDNKNEYLKKEVLKNADLNKNIRNQEIKNEIRIQKKVAQPIADNEIVFAAKPSLKHAGINTWLVNNSSWEIKYVISQPGEGGHYLFSEGILESDTKVFLRRINPDNINELLIFDFQFIFYKQGIYNKKDPAVVRIYLEPAGIFNGKDMHNNDYFTENASVLSVFDFKKIRPEKDKHPEIKDIKKIILEKNDIPEPVRKEEKSSQGEKIEEVDLHIESLVDDHRNLTNGEIVEIQMSRFKTSLETAIIHKTPKIVFIHGVGNGKLKYEIRRTLDQKYPALQYQDASFREYGFGATMVMIK